MSDDTIFSGAPGEDVDNLRINRAVVISNVKNVSAGWRGLEEAEKSKANYHERLRIDEGVIDIIDQIDKLSKMVVAATLERPSVSERALSKMDKFRRKMYVTLGALRPLAEEDEELEPAGDHTIALFDKCVDYIAPGVVWAPTMDEQGLSLGAEAATINDANPSLPPPDWADAHAKEAVEPHVQEELDKRAAEAAKIARSQKDSIARIKAAEEELKRVEKEEKEEKEREGEEKKQLEREV